MDYVRCIECWQIVHNIARRCPYCGSWVPTRRNGLEWLSSHPSSSASIGFAIDLWMAGIAFGLIRSPGKMLVLGFVGVPVAAVILHHRIARLPDTTQFKLVVLAWIWVPLVVVGGGLCLLGILIWALWTM